MLALAVGFVFHRTITRPVRELIVRTCAIARGDKSARRPLEHHGTAEFAQLSQSFLDMATALESRSDYIATFAAHVSHELKSPLSSNSRRGGTVARRNGFAVSHDECRDAAQISRQHRRRRAAADRYSESSSGTSARGAGSER